MSITCPHGLTVERRIDPVGMDADRPRLSWKLPDGGASDVGQVAYRIRVATCAERLALPDCWDSGHVRSEQSIDVEYAGALLEPSAEYVWTVETLDNHGRRAVSAPARFRTGLLRPENWRAKWITVNPATLEDYDLHGAAWMAVDESGTTVFSFDATPGDIDPRAAELTETRFSWRPSLEVFKTRPAVLACAADKDFTVEVNGRTALKIGGGRMLRYVDVAGHLREGRNEVRATVKGGGALLATLTLPDGRVLASKGDAAFGPRSGDAAESRIPGDESNDAAESRIPGGAPGDRALPFRRVETFSPAFRKAFRTKKPVRDAVLHISGLGFYEAFLDGRRIGGKVLDPAPTDYDDRVLYSTYEIAAFLAVSGEHSLEVLLGRGAYDIHAPEVWNLDESPWRSTPCLIAQLELRYADGTAESIVTDGSWRQVGSPVVWDDLREGEIHAPGQTPPVDLPAAETHGPKGRLEAMPLPGAEKTETWRPVSIERLECGHWGVDFGQNLSGWARLKIRGLAACDVVTVQYGEKRHDNGTVKLDGNDQFFLAPHSVLRMPGGWFQRDRHVATGAAEEVFEPKFSYSGFRYLEIGVLREPLRAEDVEAYQVNTAFEPAGSFECSSDLVNRIHRLFVRAYLCNFTDGVPTDCPQREKNGWTGDAHLAAEMGQYCFENTAGYEKWCRDILDAQRPDGGIPRLVPFSGWGAEGAGPAWDAAVAVVPWTLWRYRGDRRILEETYSALKRYIEWGEKRLDQNGLADYGLGDWCAPMPDDTWSRYTPRALTSTAWWHEALRIAAAEARLLGCAEDAASFAAMADKARDAARRAFEKPDGSWANGTQCAQAAAIAGGLVSPELRPAAGRKLAEAVEATGRTVKCGIQGVKWLFRALSETGRGDLAIDILKQTAYPSFGDWLAHGATTAWESWKDPTSQNHVMFGDVSAWLFQYPGGIRLDESGGAVGFRRILLAPDTAGLDWVRCSHECPYGTIRSEWRIEGGAFEWTVEVPPNTTATLVPPPAASGAIPIGGEGAIPATFGRRPAWRVGSGKFEIRTPFSRNL